MDNYSIENLCQVFLKHSINAENNRIRDLEKFPDAEHLKNDFNIAKALNCICKELRRLQIHNENKWIKISEKKPKIGQICKIHAPGNIAIGTWDGNDWIDIHSGRGSLLAQPYIEWMTLPYNEDE